MGERAWDELTERDLDDLEQERQDLREERTRLEAECKGLRAHVQALTYARDLAQERLEHEVNPSPDFEEAAERLVKLLDRLLGFEQVDDSIEVHDLFMALADFRDTLRATSAAHRRSAIREHFYWADKEAHVPETQARTET